MITPLPSVKATCLLQQEESQRQILHSGKSEVESSAIYSRYDERCTECGNKGHGKQRCWLIIGYPNWHPKAKKQLQSQKQKEETTSKAQGGTKTKRHMGQGMVQMSIMHPHPMMLMMVITWLDLAMSHSHSNNLSSC